MTGRRGRRPLPPGGRTLFSAGLLLVVLALPSVSAASANVSVGSDGSVSLTLVASIPNGSAVREAMDGNFTDIVDAITSNTSQRASILQQIGTAESTPFVGALFGNRDGTVESGEVTTFVSLLQYEASLLPAGSISGGSFLSFTLDGQRASSTHIGAIAFANATGSATSSAPIVVTTTVTDSFSSTGTTHTLAFTTNISSTPLPIALLTGSVALTVVTPAGTSVTGTAGFDSSTTSNDPLGWGTSSVAGSYTPSSSGSVSVSFGPAFPTGDVAIAAPIVAAAVLGLFLLLQRRRRRRAALA